MKKSAQVIACLLTIATAMGCPAPEAVTSIDGLEGGSVTSAVDAPEVTAESGTIGSLTTTTTTSGTTTTTTLTSATSTLGAATATSLDTAALTVTGAAEFSSVATDTLVADAITADSLDSDVLVGGALRLRTTGILDDGSLIGNVVGVTSTGGGSYDSVDRACFNAFPGSHICGEADVLHFLRSANFTTQVQALTATALDGASYATVTHAVVGFDGANQPIIANDCDSWTRISIAGEPPGLNARHIVDIEPLGDPPTLFRGRVATSNICSVDDLRILCCGG